MRMDMVNVHEAKTHLSRLLARVARGEEIVIAKGGHPVAKLISPRERPARPPERADPHRQGLRRAAAEGDRQGVRHDDEMKVLLDTHAFLWWLGDDPKLSPAAREAIRDPDALVHVSAASIWEIAIKLKLGWLDVQDSDCAAEIEANGFVELAISARHAQRAGALPRHHDDPFDRMLIAQAQLEDLVLITHDRRLRRYGTQIVAT
jgi:prevent-host-death family protein